MKYLTINASLNSTGIRNYYEGSELTPQELCLTPKTTQIIKEWLLCYEQEHYRGYKNENYVEELDKKGLEIAQLIKDELGNVKVEYFSEAHAKIMRWMS
jgi:hypothetical protein